ncbi:hypothetical protein OIU34_00105 [Pararhizobium sp. BT-229]|uniref:hypothetical protein n=1 Tax=Pararhizobium sp. BT-229 TaxID=2986923 RepID=UPI0021F75212|nr:hypothetical protein [Pararhizobium sp. BT-229]MCV9960290.1 hypothetical protein [Pararhizobium sp. BT-229]
MGGRHEDGNDCRRGMAGGDGVPNRCRGTAMIPVPGKGLAGDRIICSEINAFRMQLSMQRREVGVASSKFEVFNFLILINDFNMLLTLADTFVSLSCSFFRSDMDGN